MSKVQNTFDLGRALGEDVLTSTTRFHRNLSSYFSSRTQKKNEVEREWKQFSLTEDQLKGDEKINAVFSKVLPYLAQLHVGYVQLVMSMVAGIPLLDKDSGMASSMMVMAGTVMATNDAMMRVTDKVLADWNSIENGVNKLFVKLGASDGHLEFEYEKQPMYPKFREVLARIRSDGDDEPPQGGSPEL